MAPSRAVYRLATATTAVATAAVLLAALPAALAHGGDQSSHENHDFEDPQGHGGHGEYATSSGSAHVVEHIDSSAYPPTYFSHGEHTGMIYAHIALMSFAWVVVLPVAVMFSLVSSRYTLISQFGFLITNIVGVLVGIVYNTQTPDLYPGNAHHSVGWVATWVVSAQIFIGLLGRLSRRLGAPGTLRAAATTAETHHFVPLPSAATESIHASSPAHLGRFSDDSGHGTEQRTESVRSNSVSTAYDEEASPSPYKEYDDDESRDFEDMPTSAPAPPPMKWAGRLADLISTRIWKYAELAYKVVDRVILPLGFVALTTGVVTFGRFFEGRMVFSGLAHWIKGGVFFWLGLFNLGRWSGSFAELGWAWNARPRRFRKHWRPSAEFVESALIFFYGSTNIFLEHLGGWGEEWTAQDLEHISITVLFLGGGLCGMLIESTRIREFLNTNVGAIDSRCSPQQDDVETSEHLKHPETYDFSINPIPALVILLLGIMMSSHQQETMIASMVHKQWGHLLTGASVARFLTYIILFLKPPRSMFPSRPPTELLSSFGLIAGGIIFMASSSDTVDGMIHYELDAMFMYTVTMGFVGLLMAWEILVLALKGWASRLESRH